MRAPPSPSSPLSPLAVYSHWSRTPLPPPPPITPTPPRRLVLLLLLLLLRSSPPSRLSELSLGYDHPQQHEEATEDHQFEHGKQALAVATVSAANAGPTGVVVVDLSVLWMDTGCACRRAKTRRRKQGRRGEMLKWVGGGGGRGEERLPRTNHVFFPSAMLRPVAVVGRRLRQHTKQRL